MSFLIHIIRINKGYFLTNKALYTKYILTGNLLHVNKKKQLGLLQVL